MNLRLRNLASVVVLLACAATTLAAGPPDYIRYAHDRTGARLETALKTLLLPSGQKVDLISVVHIADDAYYQGLNQRFGAYDSVLFELVGDPARLTASAPLPLAQRTEQAGGGTVSAIQQAAAKYLELTFQLGAVDYTGRNMVHADASAEQFEKMQQERGENLMTMFARAMQAQARAQARDKIDPNTRAVLDTIKFVRMLMSPDLASEFKKELAMMLADMEAMTAEMEGPRGTAILGGRNDVVVRKIKEVLAWKKQRHIAVFYGGAHMPGIEQALIRDLKARVSGEEWLAAWTMPERPKAREEARER
jgi:hypothetical protein